MEYITKREFLNRRPDLTDGQFHFWRFHGDKNGFNTCIRKVGKTLFVSPQKFDEWVDQYGQLKA